MDEFGVEDDGLLAVDVLGFEGDELRIDGEGLLGGGEELFLGLVVAELVEEVGGGMSLDCDVAKKM